MLDKPRNYRIDNVELNWVRVDTPTSPFGVEQYEAQIATTKKTVAAEWKKNHLNVKEKDGKFVVSLKRKAANGKVRVVNSDLSPMEDTRSIGNGSMGNVIVFQGPYSNNFGKGVTNSLTAIQITKLEKYEAMAGAEFDAIDSAPKGSEDLF